MKGKNKISVRKIALKQSFRKEGNILGVTISEVVMGPIKAREPMSSGENCNDFSEDARIQNTMDKTL